MIDNYSNKWTVLSDATIPDIKSIRSITNYDNRGYLFETYNKNDLASSNIVDEFVNEHQSGSKKGTIRGLHYQLPFSQGKLLRVLVGEIIDVAVDLRKDSSTFGKWTKTRLTPSENQQIWIPIGFAHGYYVTSGWAEIFYKATEIYSPENEHVLAWNDPFIAIDWELEDGVPILLSDKDSRGKSFLEIPLFY